MNVKNIKSFIEFYKFLGVTNCMAKTPRNFNKIEKFSENPVNNSNFKHMNFLTKNEQLNNLHEEILKLNCNLKDTATNVVVSDGNHNSKIMFIGEAPGANEDLEGKPFVGEAGQLLNKMISFIGLSRENIYVSNIVFWRPPGNRTPNDKEISSCLPLTRKHISIISPKLLVFVGSIAAKSLLQSKDGITKLRGKKHEYFDNEYGLSIPSRAIFHPAYLMRNPIEKKRTWDDLIEIDDFCRSNGI